MAAEQLELRTGDALPRQIGDELAPKEKASETHGAAQPLVGSVNLFPRDTAAIAAMDSSDSYTFNNGICEAQFSVLGVGQQ
jgi:hypothetical protein